METKQFKGVGLPYSVVEPDGYDPDRPYPLVILMHGYGSHMGDLVSLSPHISTDGYLFAFPNAPLRIEIGLGMIGFAWSSPPELEFDPDGSAERLVDEFITDVFERYKIKIGHVVLGGFSQGGMMAYRHGLRHPDKFKGLISLSSRISPRDIPKADISQGCQSIFISHGTLDEIIPIDAGHIARDLLTEKGYSTDYHEYEMAHQITQEVIEDISNWLQSVAPKNAGNI